MERDEGMNQAVAYALAGMLPIAISAALVGVRDEIVNANAALALVVAVVVCSLLGGWRAGSVAAVVSTLCYDFFFTRPYRSLNMTSQDDIETTVLLLIVGLIVGVSAARARRTKTSAAAGRSEILRIHRLGELAVSGADVADVITSARWELKDLLHLEGCWFEPPPYHMPLPTLQRSGVVSGVHERRMSGGNFELPRDGVELGVVAHGETVGRFVLEPSRGVGVSLEQRVVAIALADQVGQAIGAAPRSPFTK
jgi:hypothetical protein